MNGIIENGRTPEIIAAEINSIKAQTRDIVCRNAIEIGRRLTEVKCRIPFGSWGKWLAENVDYSERTAQDLMRLFDEYGRGQNPQAIADLSYTQALLLTRLDGESREELLAEKDVPGMSTRELQAEIERINAEKAQQQLTIDALLAEKAEAEEALKAAEDAAKTVRGYAEEDQARIEAAEADAARARDQAADAVQRANETSAENARLKAELQAERDKPAPLPVVEQVEVVPPEVTAELEALRKRAAQQDGAVMLLRDAYSRMVAQFEDVERRIAELAEGMPEEAARYRAAVAKAAARMAERLEQNG